LPKSSAAPVFILAADHRDTLRTMFGLGNQLDERELGAIADIKEIILDALLDAAPRLNGSRAGILIDERFGSAAARRAKEAGVALAMPVEKSLRPVFEFEFDSEWKEHIHRFAPDYVKALAIFNPEGPENENSVQIERLLTLADWLDENSYTLMLEILVPGTREQLASFDSTSQYDAVLRPELMCTTVEMMHAAGIRPDVWKIEGTETREAAEMIVAATRRGGKAHVESFLLGRGQDDANVDRWIRSAAGVDGFGGFAIGRSIWAPAIGAYLDHTTDRDKTVEAIRDKYLRFVDVYQAAS